MTLKLLYTGDEHGWIARASEKGRARGGAAELLARWKSLEHHCVPGADDDCRGSDTLALSGGDNWTGPAISSFFKGEPAAQVLQKLGYAASALGNHELDFGRAWFDKNAAQQRIPYVSANVSPTVEQGGVTKPFVIVERQGVKVGVVGLTTRETPKLGLRKNYDGLSFGDEEEALSSAVPSAYAAGADVVVVIAHMCAAELRPIVARHPDWGLGFVGAAHCHKSSQDRVFMAPLVEAGSFMREYVRATLVVAPDAPRGAKVLDARSEKVDLTYPEGDKPPVEPDAALSREVSAMQKRADDALGEVIGHSNETFDYDSPALVNFITDRWREAQGADVAILNRFGTRQALSKGPVTLQSVYSVLPFDNVLVTVKLTGDQLLEDLNCCNGYVSGVKRDDKGGWLLLDGRAIEASKTYTVVGTDYTYYGGSGFLFEKQDKNPTIGVDWREPIIKWLREHRTTPERGLEQLVDKVARTKR